MGAGALGLDKLGSADKEAMLTLHPGMEEGPCREGVGLKRWSDEFIGTPFEKAAQELGMEDVKQDLARARQQAEAGSFRAQQSTLNVERKELDLKLAQLESVDKVGSTLAKLASSWERSPSRWSAMFARSPYQLDAANLEVKQAGLQVTEARHNAASSRLYADEDGLRVKAAELRAKYAEWLVGQTSTDPLCAKIASTIHKGDFARFDSVYEEPGWGKKIAGAGSVVTSLTLLAKGFHMSSEDLWKTASAGVLDVQRMDVVQVRPEGYGFHLKYASAPHGMAPKETVLTAQEARQCLPASVLKVAAEQGVATVTNVEAQPDTLMSTTKPISEYGMYKVINSMTGAEMVGFVIPNLIDPTKAAQGSMLFTSGGQYAIQPGITGTLVAISHDLPSSTRVRGLGVFYKSNGRQVQATVPYNIVSAVTVEGASHYAAQDGLGNDIQLTPSEGLIQPAKINDKEIAIPSDWEFMTLDNPVQVEGEATQDGTPGLGSPAPSADKASKPSDKSEKKIPMKEEQKKQASTMMELRAWEGGCDLRGPVFSKLGSGTHSWADGLFLMAAAGVPQNLGVELLTKSADARDVVRLFGLRPLDTAENMRKAAWKEAEEKLAGIDLPPAVNLLKEVTVIVDALSQPEVSEWDKEAAALIDVDSVDTVLALNFINPENIALFTENTPMLESTSAKLASLVLASQLGLPSVPRSAAVRAMECLEDVITGLRALQPAKI